MLGADAEELCWFNRRGLEAAKPNQAKPVFEALPSTNRDVSYLSFIQRSGIKLFVYVTPLGLD